MDLFGSKLDKDFVDHDSPLGSWANQHPSYRRDSVLFDLCLNIGLLARIYQRNSASFDRI